MEGSSASSARIGLFYGIIAYGLWGLIPVYFKAVGAVPPREMLAHRVVWSAVFLVLVVIATSRLWDLRASFRTKSTMRRLTLSSLLIGTNWYVFIYSVMTGQIMQGSLGYFILPLVNVAIGTIFFRERMSALQWLAVVLATLGVVNLVWQLGIFPWIAVTLAFSFSMYGVVRKQTPVDGLTALTVETLLLTPIALGFLFAVGWQGDLRFSTLDRSTDYLLILSGIATSVPLLCFAQAIRRLRLITIGFLQYISPSLAFGLAVLKYDERFDVVHQISYGLIWSGLTLFVVDALLKQKSK